MLVLALICYLYLNRTTGNREIKCFTYLPCQANLCCVSQWHTSRVYEPRVYLVVSVSFEFFQNIQNGWFKCRYELHDTRKICKDSSKCSVFEEHRDSEWVCWALRYSWWKRQGSGHWIWLWRNNSGDGSGSSGESRKTRLYCREWPVFWYGRILPKNSCHGKFDI